MSDKSNILVLQSQIIGRPTSTQERSNVLWSVLSFYSPGGAISQTYYFKM